MTTTTVDGVSYDIPSNGERGWGTEASNLLKALGDNSLLIKGGSIPLTSEADFGASFGLKSIYFSSRTADAADSGALRLANTDDIGWRNGANDANLFLDIASDKLQFDGVDLVDISSSQTLTNKTYDAASNSLSNVDTTMWAAGVLLTSTTLAGASNLNVPSSLAVKTYIDDQVAGKDDASEITYTPADVNDWDGDVDPGNVNDALDQLASRATDADDHIANTSNPHSVTKTQVGLGEVENLKVNLAATTAPAVDDDSADGYAVGSRWIDTTGDKEYVCVDASIGAAVWGETTATGGGGGGGVYSEKSADYTITNLDDVRTVGMTTGATDKTVTLPAAADNTDRIITVKKLDANPAGHVIVDGAGGES